MPYSGADLITFKTNTAKYKILKTFYISILMKLNLFLYKSITSNAITAFNNYVIRVSDGPEPGDIIWENLVIS